MGCDKQKRVGGDDLETTHGGTVRWRTEELCHRRST